MAHVPAPEPSPLVGAESPGVDQLVTYSGATVRSVVPSPAWEAPVSGHPRRYWDGPTLLVAAHTAGSPFVAHRVPATDEGPARWDVPDGFRLHHHDRDTDDLVGWLPLNDWDPRCDVFRAADPRFHVRPDGLYVRVGSGSGGTDERDADGNPTEPRLVPLGQSAVDVFLDGAPSLTYGVIADRVAQLARTLGWSGIMWLADDGGHGVVVRAADLT